MSTSRLIVVVLVVLHLFLSQTQGIRVLKSLEESTEIEMGNVMVKKDGEQAILRSEEDSGNVQSIRRKVLLVQTSTWIPKTTSESLKKGTMEAEYDEKEESDAKASSSSTRVSGRTRKFKARKYEDLMDINVMDYTPAKRKTPIHN